MRPDSAARKVQLRRVAGCPNAGRVRELVRRASDATGVAVDLEELVGDYPSPTLLVEGRDVTGRPLTEGASCRLDLPTERQIKSALQAMQPGGAPQAPG